MRIDDLARRPNGGMTTSSDQPIHVVARLAALQMIGWGVVGTAVVAAAYFAGGGGVANAALLAIGVVWVGGWAGLTAPLCVWRQPIHVVAMAALGGLGMRFAATFAGGLALQRAAGLSGDFLIWIGALQMVGLAIDTAGLISAVRRRPDGQLKRS